MSNIELGPILTAGSHELQADSESAVTRKKIIVLITMKYLGEIYEIVRGCTKADKIRNETMR